MKTATIEELHDQQTEVLGWVKAGEEVAISHGGIVIARLVPEKEACSGTASIPNGGTASTAAPAYLRDRSTERILSTEQVAALLDENKGSW